MQTHFKKRFGFTLIEMLVVIAITSAVGLAVTTMIQYFYQKNAYLLEQTDALDNARRTMLDAVRTLREASYGDDGSYPIATAGTSTITFFADLDNDGSVEKIRYYLVNSTLYRGVTNSAGSPPVYTGQTEAITTVAASVRNTKFTPLFTYYDSSGEALSTTSTNISQISAVTISAWIDINPNRAPNVFNLSETATLRNLR
jgi:prepilin-type N-terminal cleavage/methylation domain-containing protein